MKSETVPFGLNPSPPFLELKRADFKKGKQGNFLAGYNIGRRVDTSSLTIKIVHGTSLYYNLAIMSNNF